MPNGQYDSRVNVLRRLVSSMKKMLTRSGPDPEVVLRLPVDESQLELYGGEYPIQENVTEPGTYLLLRVESEYDLERE